MAQIPTWLWLASGILLMVFSRLFGGRVAIFFWPGLLFLVVGIFRIVAYYITRKEAESEKKVLQQQMVQPVLRLSRFCSKCGSRLPADAVFCSYCGAKVV